MDISRLTQELDVSPVSFKDGVRITFDTWISTVENITWLKIHLYSVILFSALSSGKKRKKKLLDLRGGKIVISRAREGCKPGTTCSWRHSQPSPPGGNNEEKTRIIIFISQEINFGRNLTFVRSANSAGLMSPCPSATCSSTAVWTTAAPTCVVMCLMLHDDTVSSGTTYPSCLSSFYIHTYIHTSSEDLPRGYSYHFSWEQIESEKTHLEIDGKIIPRSISSSVM